MILGVPLAGTIAVVTFVGAYVPFVGAWVAGGFAVLIALSTGSSSDALIMAVVALLANGVLQQMIQPFVMGATLGIHPLVVLVVTIGAGALFGMVGLTLAAPLTSAAVHRRGRRAGAGPRPAHRVARSARHEHDGERPSSTPPMVKAATSPQRRVNAVEDRASARVGGGPNTSIDGQRRVPAPQRTYGQGATSSSGRSATAGPAVAASAVRHHASQCARRHGVRCHTSSWLAGRAGAYTSASSSSSARNTSVAFTRLLTSSASDRFSFRKIELMCFSTARLVSTSDSAIEVLLLPGGYLGQNLSLAGSELRERRPLGARLGGHERLHDLGVDHRPAGRDGPDGPHELGPVVNPLLEQVGTAVGSRVQQRQGVARLRVLAED